MGERAHQLAKRIRSFSDDVIEFVENISKDDWSRTCESEQWSVGVTAYHIGAGHLAIFGIADMIIKGETLPQLTMDDINAMSNKEAQKNTDCTKADAMAQLKTNSAKMVAFVQGLSDEALDTQGSMPAFNGEVTTEQLIGYVLFQSAAEHFTSIKNTLGN